MKLLKCPTAIINQIGLGRKRSKVKLYVDDHKVMASQISNSWSAMEEEIEVIPLDEYTQLHNINHVAFIKIDAEGMEVDILEGSRKTLLRANRVAMETHTQEMHRDSIRRLLEAGLFINIEKFSGKSGFVFASRQA